MIWFRTAPKGMPVFNISLPYLFNAANRLDSLRLLPDSDTPIEAITAALADVRLQMMALHDPALIYGHGLRPAHAAGEHLAQAIKDQTDDQTAGRMVSAETILNIKRRYEDYRSVLLGALSAMGSFLVSRKGSHEVYALLFEGETLYPGDLREKVPEAIFDAQQAGKCLAFDVATACGFHAFRVTESVVRRYWTFATGNAAHPKVRSLGVYIAAFTRTEAGDPKVIAALKQLNELHRNPLVHPETALTPDEALNIVGLSRSAVAAMLVHLPKPPPTTTTAAV